MVKYAQFVLRLAVDVSCIDVFAEMTDECNLTREWRSCSWSLSYMLANCQETILAYQQFVLRIGLPLLVLDQSKHLNEWP